MRARDFHTHTWALYFTSSMRLRGRNLSLTVKSVFSLWLLCTGYGLVNNECNQVN